MSSREPFISSPRQIAVMCHIACWFRSVAVLSFMTKTSSTNLRLVCS